MSNSLQDRFRGLRDLARATMSPDLDDSVHESVDGMPDDPSQSVVEASDGDDINGANSEDL